MPAQTQRGDGSIASNHSQLGTKTRSIVSTNHRSFCFREDSVPFSHEACLASGWVLTAQKTFLHQDSIPGLSIPQHLLRNYELKS